MANDQSGDERYRGYVVRILAQRVSGGDAWATEMHIQRRDGTWLPAVGSPMAYPSREVAFAGGKTEAWAAVDRDIATLRDGT